MAVAFGILLIPLMLLSLAIIPILAALIYKGSYTRHLNEQMESGYTSKKWISPLGAGLITFLGEVLILVGVFGLFMARTSSLGGDDHIEINANGCRSWTFSTDEAADTEYAVFNGDLVENYAMTIGESGDFIYYAYHRMAGSEDMPMYALVVEYRGNKKIGDFVGSTNFGKDPNGIFLGNGAPNSGDNRVVVIIQPDDIQVTTTVTENGVDKTETYTVPKEDIPLSYTLELYEPTPANAPDSFDPKVIERITIDLSDLSF